MTATCRETPTSRRQPKAPHGLLARPMEYDLRSIANQHIGEKLVVVSTYFYLIAAVLLTVPTVASASRRRQRTAKRFRGNPHPTRRRAIEPIG